MTITLHAGALTEPRSCLSVMGRMVLHMAEKNASASNVESSLTKQAEAKDSDFIHDDALNDVNAAGSGFVTQARNYLRKVERQ